MLRNMQTRIIFVSSFFTNDLEIIVINKQQKTYKNRD